MTTLPQSFQRKKRKILEQLAVPETEYDDLSPKGSVDAGIRDLIDEINGREGLVTTSSCGGRVSVFLEGVRNSEGGGGGGEEGEDGRIHVGKGAGVGGKGGGGRWLFVSHDRIELDQVGESIAKLLGMGKCLSQPAITGTRPTRLIHFKFEPMILHILTASLSHANLVLTAAHQSGFRESGALNLTTPTTSTDPPTPMVGVRTMGLSLESIIGSTSNPTSNSNPNSNPTEEENPTCFVPEEYLRILIETANTRFLENTKRIERFRKLLGELFEGFGVEKGKGRVKADGSVWEDKEVRRERLREEGLRRAREGRVERGGGTGSDDGGYD